MWWKLMHDICQFRTYFDTENSKFLQYRLSIIVKSHDWIERPNQFLFWLERWNWLDLRSDYVTLAFIVFKRRYCKNSLIRLLSTCVTKWKASIMAGFRKAHMRAFCYSIRNMDYINIDKYTQMRFTESSLFHQQ